jgi:hypothetical protein
MYDYEGSLSDAWHFLRAWYIPEYGSYARECNTSYGSLINAFHVHMFVSYRKCYSVQVVFIAKFIATLVELLVVIVRVSNCIYFACHHYFQIELRVYRTHQSQSKRSVRSASIAVHAHMCCEVN